MTRRIIHTQDGTVILSNEKVGDEQGDGYACDCHRRMGNDFWFLPTGQCLHRDDGVCNKRTEPVKSSPGETA